MMFLFFLLYWHFIYIIRCDCDSSIMDLSKDFSSKALHPICGILSGIQCILHSRYVLFLMSIRFKLVLDFEIGVSKIPDASKNAFSEKKVLIYELLAVFKFEHIFQSIIHFLFSLLPFLKNNMICSILYSINDFWKLYRYLDDCLTFANKVMP